MFYPFHDVHLVFHFLIEDAVLDEFPLVQFLCCVRDAVELVCDLVDRGKGALSDLADPVIPL